MFKNVIRTDLKERDGREIHDTTYHTVMWNQFRFILKENKYMRYKTANGPMWTSN